MATGENLFSMQDARNLIRYGGMRPDRDLLQFDCALSYGLVEYLRTLGDAEGERLVGAARASRTAGTRCRSTSRPASGWAATSRYPGVFQPFGGFADDVAVEDGYVALPDTPGIGFERKAELYAADADGGGVSEPRSAIRRLDRLLGRSGDG